MHTSVRHRNGSTEAHQLPRWTIVKNWKGTNGIFKRNLFATLISVQVILHLFISVSFQKLHICKLSLRGSTPARLWTSKWLSTVRYRISEKRMTNYCQITFTANKTVSSFRKQVKHVGTIQTANHTNRCKDDLTQT